MEMGWDYLPPAESDKLRGGRLGTAILEPVLVEFLRENARFEFKGREHMFTENAIASAVETLKSQRTTGAIHQNEEMYDRLCLGTSESQTIDGDSKSFNLSYIDWKNPEKNSYHCTAEYRVERIGQRKHYIPDIVLFINGLPLGIVECKRSAYQDQRKAPIDLAVDQLLGYQKKDGIPQLFVFSQLLLALARDKAEYGTTGTPRKFWSVWREEGLDSEIAELLNRPLQEETGILEAPFSQVADEFQALHEGGRNITEQDRAIFALCRPERLLPLIFRNIVYDNGIKKIARYQQFFTIEDILKRVLAHNATTEDREGGVVWHTQGSGKSLTMVMLAKALALAPQMLTPKVILVTDRIDLDSQIADTFRHCGIEPQTAKTGKHLVELLQSDKASVVTTLIHKFDAASKSSELKGASRDTFVLVDEGHRGQYAEQHTRMKIALKGACFIAFTGTPLAKKAKKNTFATFGHMFEPPYTIVRAVEDKAVLPLVYEARHVPQRVDQAAIDNWFEKITSALNDEQRTDLKRKFSSERQLNKAAQKVRMIAHDVSVHYSVSFQGTGLKGQLVAPDKATALLYKECFDEFGMVSTEVLISAPTVQEGESKNPTASQAEHAHWQKMMDRYGSEEKYNKQLINAFKKSDEPEIIIVVDKLLTGFDAPCNTVLYLARKLKDHTLLQAIARVNRLHEGKDRGFIMDYSGVIEELDEAIDFYTQLADFDTNDLANTVSAIEEEIRGLASEHSSLWDLFPGLLGTRDHEPFEERLRDEERRAQFYDRFNRFARSLATALSSTNFLVDTDEATVSRYKTDLKFFQNLRASVSIRFQERIDFTEYEPRIQKLVDTHVAADEIVTLSEPINLFDAQQRLDVLEDEGKSAAAKADTIAAATERVIEREMTKDPAFYSKFSDLIKEVIEALYAGRIKAIEALDKLKDIATTVATHRRDSVPSELVGKDQEQRFFGLFKKELSEVTGDTNSAALKISLGIRDLIHPHKIRDWRNNEDAKKQMRLAIDDLIFDTAAEMRLEIPIDLQNKILDHCIDLAKANDD